MGQEKGLSKEEQYNAVVKGLNGNNYTESVIEGSGRGEKGKRSIIRWINITKGVLKKS